MTSPLDSKVVPFGNAADKIVQFVEGPSGLIETEHGQLPTLRRLTEGIQEAGNEAVSHIEVLAGTVFRTPAEGLQVAAPGEFFNVRGSTSDAYVDEYQNVAGVAIPTGKSYPSANGLQQQFLDMTNSVVLIATVVIGNNAFS
jgi:hypothetical protein